MTSEITGTAPSRVTRGGAVPPASAESPARRRRRRPRIAPWLFMAPSAIILGVFVLFPIVRSLYYSFFDWTVGASTQPFVGFGNYIKLFHDSQFWNALRVTLEYTVVSVVLLLVLGFITALLLQGESLANRIVRSVFFFPTIVSLVTIGMVWKFLLDPSIGLVDGLAATLGLPSVAWLTSVHLALPTVIFVGVWKSTGFAMILFIAGLKGVPQERYEASNLDGAGRWQTIWSITLPSIRPTLLFTSLILTIQSFQVFDLVYVMTGGGPLYATDSLVNLLYRDGFVNFQTGYASAISWVLFAIIMIISLLQLRLFRYNDVD
ncbi:carbohydrate ABC transporter permease [Frondihabitans australicus]|uniref:Carbohydrate ABC transporter membrane protein 1 (CUT1 family) n=1 Tax=Frondihabitans australicus TaxID=386892 RepID=A0A495IBZ0_9MICO|nr:sugar ABC transporter permease [Frondihabitans australicus]RKR73442.1 carbohydrate ABC transporter membrane protein 1 (CUT1 family) [Frondihabitans australicus]